MYNHGVMHQSIGKKRAARCDGAVIRRQGNYVAPHAIIEASLFRARHAHDPQIAVRRIPSLFPQGRSKDRPTPQSRYLQVARRGGEARARRAIFQTALTPMKRIARSARIWLGFLTLAAICTTTPVVAQNALPGSAKVGPPLETVKSFEDDFRLVGIGVSAKGRVFATAPSSNVRSRYSMVEVDPRTGAVTPYPDAAWNNFSEQGDAKSEWISVQALWVDKSDHLWALDSSLSNLDQDKLPPKLVEFDLATNRVIREYDFKGVVSAKDALNDLRIDVAHHYAYLTNA